MKFLTVFLLSICITTCEAQHLVSVYGRAPLIKDGTILYFSRVVPYGIAEQETSYQAIIINGAFTIKLGCEPASRYKLKLSDHFRDVYFEPGKAKLEILDTVLKSILITGNKSAIEGEEHLKGIEHMPSSIAYDRSFKDWIKSMRTKDALIITKKKAASDSLSRVYQNELTKYNLAWIKNHPGSYLNSSLLFDLLDRLPQNEIRSSFKRLNRKSRNNSFGRELKYRIDSIFVAGTAPDFIQNDTDNKQVSLNNFKGRYLLIDFWASWCIPCRKDNPNLIAAKKRYKGKNFDILSVSLDTDRNLWVNAIKKDNLTWDHISDLKGWDNLVARKYRVNAIPDNFLIGPNRKIIARNIHGDELIRTLQNILK